MPSQPKFDVIMFNMSTFYDWDHGIVNRNYNILNALAKQEGIGRIVAVDFLPLTWRGAVAHYVKNILLEAKTGEMVYGDLTSACYQRTDKIFTYTTIDSIFSSNTVANELKRIEKILDLKNIVFWSYNPLFVNFAHKLNDRAFIFDSVDNWLEHPTYTRLIAKKRLTQNYQVIADKADIIFTVSEELHDLYRKMGRVKNVTWIPNGVDFAHFNNPALINKTNPLQKINQPIIGYLGTIESRVDFDLVAAVANVHRDKIVAVCGPIWPIVKKEFKQKLGHLKNVKEFGRIGYHDAPSYINNFDVAIIPHKITNFVQSMNPMKLYDYLACGKPVITTRGAGVDMFKDLIYIADSQSDFVGMIDKALKEDSNAKQAERRTAVKKHSWESRATEMMKAVTAKLYA